MVPVYLVPSDTTQRSKKVLWSSKGSLRVFCNQCHTETQTTSGIRSGRTMLARSHRQGRCGKHLAESPRGFRSGWAKRYHTVWSKGIQNEDAKHRIRSNYVVEKITNIPNFQLADLMGVIGVDATGVALPIARQELPGRDPMATSSPGLVGRRYLRAVAWHTGVGNRRLWPTVTSHACCGPPKQDRDVAM